VKRLDSIPGVGHTVAEVLVAEIGTDMGRFPARAIWQHKPRRAGQQRERRQVYSALRNGVMPTFDDALPPVQHPLTQEGEARAAKHVALEHLYIGWLAVKRRSKLRGRVRLRRTWNLIGSKPPTFALSARILRPQGERTRGERQDARLRASGNGHGGLLTVHPRFAAFDEILDEREPPA